MQAEIEAAERLIAAGNRAEDEGRLHEACERYRAAIEAAPLHAPAHLNLGIGLEANGHADGALESYERALALDPENPFVNYNLGKLLAARGNPQRAERLLRAALIAKPAFAEANVALSSLFDARGDLPAAAAALEAALGHRPQYAGALLNYAAVLTKMRRWSEAESALRRAHAAEPGNPDVLSALADLLWQAGNILADEGRLDEAQPRFEEALGLRPDFAEARLSLCMLIYQQGRTSDAIAGLRELLSRKPRFAAGHLSLGKILGGERKLDEAAESLLRALALDPALAEAHLRLGEIHMARDDTAEALRCYGKALSIDAGYVEARWSIALGQLSAVYETDAASAQSRAAFSRELDALERWIGEKRLAASVSVVGGPSPFYLAYQEQNNRELLQRYGSLCSRIMATQHAGRRPQRSPEARRDVIRVGVVSAHLQNHSVWNALVKGWFQGADRACFELEAFYLGATFDAETRRAQSLATHFESEHGSSLPRWARAIAERRLDVLVYPEVGMDPPTMKLASLRLAPAQVATWGHPETSGLPSIDYFVSAHGLEPEGAADHYSEELVLLPHLGCAYPPREIAAAPANLGGAQLDRSIPVLVCPGTPYKYAPRHDRVFAEIARRLGECRFVFFTYPVPEISEKLHARLRASFAAHGLDADRFCLFAPWQTPAQFRGLMGNARVFLDTLGFSGFNTAMEAVQCALPIVTREGRFLRGRFASGILKRIGLQELVAPDEDAYIDLAVRICQDGAYRARLGNHIESQRSILFDDPAPVRALEEFLARIARRR